MSVADWSMQATAGEIFAVLVGAIADYESQEQAGDPFCPECTGGTTPEKFSRGPCWYHRAKRIVIGGAP